MTGKSPAEAVNNFLLPLQRVINCITDSVLDVSGGYYATTSEKPHLLVLSDGNPVRLTAPAGVTLLARLHYVLLHDVPAHGLWQVSITGYYYSFRDLSDREIIAYHWHPNQRSNVTIPHLHLGPAAEVGRMDIASAHIPTGHIGLVDVVHLAITGFGVRPRRADWAKILG